LLLPLLPPSRRRVVVPSVRRGWRYGVVCAMVVVVAVHVVSFVKKKVSNVKKKEKKNVPSLETHLEALLLLPPFWWWKSNGVGVGGCCYCHGAVWSSIVTAVATLRLCAMVVVVAIHVVVRWRSVVVVCGCRALQAVNKLEKYVLV
jgi:hypothetical protein